MFDAIELPAGVAWSVMVTDPQVSQRLSVNTDLSMVAWAVLANRTVLDDRDDMCGEVLPSMGKIGSAVRQHLAGGA